MRKKTGRMFLAALLLLCAALFAPKTWAEDSKTWAEDIWTRDKLTGDWWGGRTYLSDHGIDIGLRLSQYYQGVTSGGVDRNSEYGGTMDYRLNVDTNKLLGTWKGLSVNMHARTRFGQDVSADAGSFALENAGMLMPAPGDYHGTDVTGLTASYTFPFFAGRLGNVTLGMLDVIDTVTGFFPNIAYGQEGFLNVNSQVSALPWFGAIQGLSLYGGLGVTINQEYKMAQSGLLFTGTKNESTSWGSITDAFDDGVFLAGFHRFFWKMDDKPGYFMVFGGVSTKDQASNDPHDFVVIPGQGIESTEQKKPWDVALYLYQDFWRAKGDPNRKANFMIGGTVGPDNPQFAQWNFFANIEAFGLMKSRPDDRMGVGGWWNGLSDNFKDLTSPLIDLQNTYGFEVYYNFAINKWAHLSADLQLIENERANDSMAVVPGARLVLDF
jgi:porin